MREALAGLTTRGRAFLAAGVTASAAALLLGHDDLLRVGILVLVVPLITAWAISAGRYRLALVRHVAPPLVSAGQSATVELTITNEGRTPSGSLLLEEHVPYVLGTRPRFVLDGVRHGWSREIRYQVRSDVRGRYEIGPMTVRVSDPFGMVELGRAFHTTAALTVTPRTVPLSSIPIGGVWTGAGDNRPRAFAIGSAEDVTVREYRRGDDLRRVHWRSSARHGELMVRREEQPWQSRATLVLDTRARSHRGRGITSSLETAVSAAASIALHLTGRGYTVRLVTAAGELGPAWHERDPDLNAHVLLESLAVVQVHEASVLGTDWLRESGQGGLVVAVVGALGQGDAPAFRRMLHQSSHGLALTLDVDAWGTGSGVAAAPVLSGQGWRVARLSPGRPLEQAWRELGRTGRDTRAEAGAR